MAKKEYLFKGACPILIEGYGRIEPQEEPHKFVCEMSSKWEAWFLKIGAIEVERIVPAETPETPLEQPSTPAWLQMEKTADEYKEK